MTGNKQLGAANTDTEIALGRLRGAVFVLFGCVWLGIGAALTQDTFAFLKSALHAPGYVAAQEHGPAHVLVAFTAPNGDRVEFSGNGEISHRAGDRVGVVFSAEDPQHTAKLDEPGAIWALPVSFGLLGFSLLCAGLYDLLRRRRKAL